ncbi:KfrA protein (plasmid) [Xylophilus rhododendri]|uniref:KfrA protein n=1 Tax=Xylophilus rhododendri TaxID=2697032 RepID=A0A857JFX4_9BURK|nr:DNA-binding protein [Xylophilus rhododendri]QHJ01739.1 KfrA protein [Xylophilus rhododendri]
MTTAPTAIPADVRERIAAAASELFAQSARQAMPTVDAVRRAARVDMNAASTVMKEWRRAQIAQSIPVAVAVPEAVQQASAAAVAAIWLQAQELASEALRNAQAAWETERAELDALRQEMAEAFERQAGELVAAQEQVQALEDVRQLLAQAGARADQAEARLEQAEHRAAGMADELARVKGERDTATETAAKARESAAGVAGQLLAMQQQNAALLAAIGPKAAGG